MPVSKTDFIRGLQCEKMLWLDAHAPEHKIIPPEIQQRLDAGNDFGDKVMGVFGSFTETTCYREDGRLHFAKMIEKTKELLQKKRTGDLRGFVFLVWEFLRRRYFEKGRRGIRFIRSEKRSHPAKRIYRGSWFSTAYFKKMRC